MHIPSHIFVVVTALLLTPAFGFHPLQRLYPRRSPGLRETTTATKTSSPLSPSSPPPLIVTTSLSYSNWDAFEGTLDPMEIMVGGVRYEMAELPDSLMSTTLWVGNLCEFVTDDMLSNIFQEASAFNFVPACVARKPNMESLKYGFVTFPTEEETKAALIAFHGYEVNGRQLKVENIKDDERHSRIRVPGKLIEYVVGPAKKTRNGEVNDMRRARNGGEGADECSNGTNGINSKIDRDQRKVRTEKRKRRGRYKNQQKKNSRATRVRP